MNVHIGRPLLLPGHHDPGLPGRQGGGHGHQLDVIAHRAGAAHGVVGHGGGDEALSPELHSVVTSLGNLNQSWKLKSTKFSQSPSITNLVGALNQEKSLVGAFSVIVKTS